MDLLRAESISKGKQCGMASSYAEDVNDWVCDWTEALKAMAVFGGSLG